ncbi:MAG: class I SAM-dependent methyltransferase [Bacteroidota bacterium]
MEFYKSIAEQYDNIFPFNPAQKDFTLQHISPSHAEKDLLDIGCGTGSLAIQLAPHFKRVVGIDLDETMIERARTKARGEKGTTNFEAMDMAQLAQKFEPNSLDAAICFGNTLVHLEDGSAIESFFEQVNKCLKPGGDFLLQIINYDRILSEDITKLPTIENDVIMFERFYNYLGLRHRIEFNTVLTIKKTGEKVENTVKLYPLKKQEVIQALPNTGYTDVMFYGDFQGNKLTPSSMHMIVSCHKRP